MFDYRGLSGRRPSWGPYVPGRWPGVREGGPLGLGRRAWLEGVLFSRLVNVVDVGVLRPALGSMARGTCTGGIARCSLDPRLQAGIPPG